MNLVSPHTARSDRVNTMGLWEGALTLRGLCPVCACVQSSTTAHERAQERGLLRIFRASGAMPTSSSLASKGLVGLTNDVSELKSQVKKVRD